MPDNDTSVLGRIRTELTANKKKAAILGGLLLVLLIAIGRLVLSRSTPEEAAATPPVLAVPPAVDPTVPKSPPTPVEIQFSKALSTSPEARSTLNAAVSRFQSSVGNRKPASPGPREASEPAMGSVSVKDMPRTLRRDIFAASSWSAFPTDAGSAEAGESSGEGAEAGSSLWQQVREVMEEQKNRRAKNEEEVTLELAGLQLQSTMTGPAPMAYISGRLVHEGDAINGFSVVRIENKSVKLRKHGITKSLNMP